jgi:16S rRNA processing protein RimM
MAKDNLILLGHVSTAHGIRGEVVIKSYTADPADIGAYGPLCTADGGRLIELSNLRVVSKGVIAHVAGIDDRNAAEALRGTELYIEREKLPEPNEDEVYHADLIGLSALRADGSVVGEVVAMQNFGAGDLLEIRLSGKRRTEFVPFDEDFVLELDLDAGFVTVIMPDDTVTDDSDGT